MQDTFSRLAPFIKEYIFRSGWHGLKAVQEQAINVILDTEDNLLLSCGTSTGKTEAAFFPILTEIQKTSANGTAVLYIAPLKALINDQFDRISQLCKTAGINVFHRHGDVSGNNKEKFLQTPSGILQTTPESLEGLLVCRASEINTLFSSLRYIVIDELHSLFENDRGAQTLCQIARIMRIAKVNPRIVGLSATIGNTQAVCKMLSSCNGRNTVCPKFNSEKKQVSLMFEYFENQKNGEEFIYQAVKNKNSVVFSNSRDETEKITSSLRKIAENRRNNINIYIHHGNISAPLRRQAEEALKKPSQHTVVCSTSTLELGIDIGQLERVVSVGTPNTVSGFLQRMGRSGRRGGTPEMLSVFWNEEKSYSDYNSLPFSLLQAIAIVELYKRERFVEPPVNKKYPFSLLCHQTLSELASSGIGLMLPELARNVLSLPPFADISKDDYKLILSFLYKNGQIEKTDDGRIIVGLKAEKNVASYRFFSVFKEEISYTVKSANGAQIGTIPQVVFPGEKFTLAGRGWVCLKLDDKARVIYAQSSDGKISFNSRGSFFGINNKIAEYTAKILSENEIYPYLGVGAAKKLAEARKYAEQTEILNYPIHYVGNDLWTFFPWLGSNAMNTLCRCIKKYTDGILTSETTVENPYVLSFKMEKENLSEFKRIMRESLCSNSFNATELIEKNESCFTEKYDYLVPKQLLQKAYATDKTDINSVKKIIESL